MIISEIEAKLKAIREKHGDLPVYQAHSNDEEEGYFETLNVGYKELLNFNAENEDESNILCAVIDFR